MAMVVGTAPESPPGASAKAPGCSVPRPGTLLNECAPESTHPLSSLVRVLPVPRSMPIYYNSPKITALNQTMIFTHCHSSHPRNAAGANMITLCRSTLLACLTALLAVFGLASGLEARQGFGGFWSGSYYEPPAWHQRYYAPPRKRYHAPSRKKKIVRSESRRFSKSAKRRVALAVPNEPTEALPSITCEKAGAIVAEFGFNHVEVQLCTRENLEFRAMRDGKPFSIKMKANGELAKVQRLR